MGDQNNAVVVFVTAVLQQVFADLKQLVFKLRKSERADMTKVVTDHLEDSLQYALSRLKNEGIEFATVTLPRLGKELERLLASPNPEQFGETGFEFLAGAHYPAFLGHLWQLILTQDGYLRPMVYHDVENKIRARAVALVLQVSYLFYKLELPYKREVVLQKLAEYRDVDASLPSPVVDQFDGLPTHNVYSDRKVGAYLFAFDRMEKPPFGDPDPSLLNWGFDTWDEPWFTVLRLSPDHGIAKFAGSAGLEPGDKARYDEFHRSDNAFALGDSSVAYTPLQIERLTRWSTATYSDWVERKVDAARCLLGRLFDCSNGSPTGGPFSAESLVPRHGPGAVATREEPHQKYIFKRMYESVERVWSFVDYFFFSYGHLCDEEPFCDAGTLPGVKVHKSPSTRMAVVPKDSRGPRLIAMEPLELQWLQQGYDGELRRWIEGHALTRGFINFTSQDINRRLATEASVRCHVDTLDLKDASDRVSVRLVQCLFPTRILREILALRSSSCVQPDGREITLNKFCSMGSALCFSLESLVFWALAMAIVNPQYCYFGGKRGKAARATGDMVWVYGDDLIVPSGYYWSIRALFEQLDLRLNDSKCCTAYTPIGAYRESCGVNALFGENVTPIRLKHFDTVDPKVANGTWLAFAAYANAFKAKGFHRVSEYFFSELERKFGPLPYAEPGKLALSRHCRHSGARLVRNIKRLKSRRDSTTQTLQYLIVRPTMQKYKASGPVWAELFRCFMETGKAAKNAATDRIRADGSDSDDSWATLPAWSDCDVSYQPFTYPLKRAVKLVKRWTTIQ